MVEILIEKIKALIVRDFGPVMLSVTYNKEKNELNVMYVPDQIPREFTIDVGPLEEDLKETYSENYQARDQDILEEEESV